MPQRPTRARGRPVSCRCWAAVSFARLAEASVGAIEGVGRGGATLRERALVVMIEDRADLLSVLALEYPIEHPIQFFVVPLERLFHPPFSSKLPSDCSGSVFRLILSAKRRGDQVTRYVYGTTNPLGNGTDGVYDRVEYTYNRQGERTTKKDQNETVHAFAYDLLGRPIEDRVTAVGSGVDNEVRRIATRYTVRGQVETITSYDDPAVGTGTILNEVRYVYNPFGQLTADYQSHSGAVDMVTTPKVAYTYTDGSSSHIRPTQLVYPNGRLLRYEYSSGTDDALNRVSLLADDASGAIGTHLAEYSYLGLGQFVQVTYPEPNLRYDLAHGPGDDPYAGLDRFDRIVDLVWRDQTQGVDVERIQHGYDRSGNRLWRETPVAAANGVHLDELYTYDGMNQLVAFDRGDLNAAKMGLVADTKSLAQQWSLDATGNWSSFQEDADGDGTWGLDQSRSHNSANEITQIAGTSALVAHDGVGNTLRIPRPNNWREHFDLTYDAWNRLVRVLDGTNTVAQYAYDGRGFRITREAYASGLLLETRHCYYNDHWQRLEERIGSSSDAERQYVWGNRHLDDLVLRDCNVASGGNLGTSDSGLDERLYTMQDPNWNAVAVASTNGVVQERYVYTAYGAPTLLTGAFGSCTGSTCDWDVLYTGREYARETGLYHYRRRPYGAEMGRFAGRDPIGYQGSQRNLYSYAQGSPLSLTDPLGLCSLSECKRACELGELVCAAAATAICAAGPCALLLVKCVITPWPINLAFCALSVKCMVVCVAKGLAVCYAASLACRGACELSCCDP